MRREIRNIVIVLALIGAVGALASLNAGALPTLGLAGSSPLTGMLQALLIGAVGVFAVVQTLLAIRVFRLLRSPQPAGDADGARSSAALDIIWTLMPALLVVGIGLYTLLRA